MKDPATKSPLPCGSPWPPAAPQHSARTRTSILRPPGPPPPRLHSPILCQSSSETVAALSPAMASLLVSGRSQVVQLGLSHNSAQRPSAGSARLYSGIWIYSSNRFVASLTGGGRAGDTGGHGGWGWRGAGVRLGRWRSKQEGFR